MPQQELRYEKIEGRDRRIFKCGCGKEIFYKKNGINFDKYLINDTKKVHDCTVVRKFDKDCFDCGVSIKIYKVGSSWAKENQDGSEHKCKSNLARTLTKLMDQNEREGWELVDEWSEECDDEEEECNVDNVAKYRLPNGSYKVVRSHTW